MHNLSTVFKFEVIRTIKKKSFWITAIIFPIAIFAIYSIVYFSNTATQEAVENTVNQKFSIAVKDDSDLIDDQILQKFEATETSDKEAAINDVVAGKLDAFFYYPSKLSTDKIEIYAKDAGLFDDSRYENVAKAIMQGSVAPTVGQEKIAVLTGTVNFSSTFYKNGAKYEGIRELVAPMVFLVLFYVLISIFGNQMLASTTEEKENRVIEIILTTIKSRTLIIGKILALLVLALIQIITIITPVILAYILFREQLSIPSFDLSNIPLNPIHIGIGAILFTLSFLLFTGLLVAAGSAAPTAKEASGFFGIVMLLLFGPLYAVTLFVSAPEMPIVKFLSFFPLTAPIPLMLRNAVGNLSAQDTIFGIAALAIGACAALYLAIRMFQYGALEYSRRISLKTLFKKAN